MLGCRGRPLCRPRARLRPGAPLPEHPGARDSGALEQDADAILLLHREDYYEPESERSGKTDLIVAKHRNGPTATVTVAHQFHCSRLRDMSATEESAP